MFLITRPSLDFSTDFCTCLAACIVIQLKKKEKDCMPKYIRKIKKDSKDNVKNHC